MGIASGGLRALPLEILPGGFPLDPAFLTGGGCLSTVSSKPA